MASERRRNRDRGIALAIGGAFFLLYALTLCRTVFWYDSAEYVTAAVTLGIPHPPGYPLYTLLAHLFTYLPLDPAVAVNALSAVGAACAVALVYRIARELELSRAASVVGAATLGGSKLFWSNAVIAEVYCPALAAAALVLLLLLRARASGRLRTVALAAGITGLALGIHLSIATLGLGFALLVWSKDTHVGRLPQLRDLFARDSLASRARNSAVAALSAALGSCIFLYLPLRASMHPALNVGDPSTLDRFLWHVTGGNYKYWFGDVDWLERAETIGSFFVDQLLVIGVVLAVIGLVALVRKRPVEGLALLAMIAGNVFMFFDYVVHDLDVFFLPTTLVLAIAVAAGVDALSSLVAWTASGERQANVRKLVTAGSGVFVLALTLGHYREVDMSDFDDTTEFIDALLAELPAGAVVLDFTTPPEWKLNAVFGMYVQKVRGRRPDVEVLKPQSPRQILERLRAGRPVYAYAPVEPLRPFVLEPAGPVLRVVGLRRRGPLRSTPEGM